MEYKSNIFNIFISHDSGDEQHTLYENIHTFINEKYKEEINIIDVDSNKTNIKTSLCDSILKEINKSNLFICILTPIMIVKYDKEYFSINNNVVLELGYALSCIDNDNIFIFVKDDEICKREYNSIRPSMLSHVKYHTYNSFEDITDLIDVQNSLYSEYNEDITINTIALNDNICKSIIKINLTNILLTSFKSIYTKLNKIDFYLQYYECYDIHELIITYIYNEINTNYEYNSLYIDKFITILYNNLLDYKCKWILNLSNQIKIINILKIISYKLFIKFGHHINNAIINNRRNFAVIIHELLNFKYFKYIDDINVILCDSLYNESIHYEHHADYEIFVYKLQLYYKYKNNGNINKKIYYEDLIYNSQNNYNKWYIN